MPKEIIDPSEISPGEFYEDSAYHPCLCIGVDGSELWGISLIDGTYPRTDVIGLSGVRKLTIDDVWNWKLKGPDVDDVPPNKRWWS